MVLDGFLFCFGTNACMPARPYVAERPARKRKGFVVRPHTCLRCVVMGAKRAPSDFFHFDIGRINDTSHCSPQTTTRFVYHCVVVWRMYSYYRSDL